MISIAVIPVGTEIEVFGRKTYMQLTDLNVGPAIRFSRSRPWAFMGRPRWLVVE